MNKFKIDDCSKIQINGEEEKTESKLAIYLHCDTKPFYRVLGSIVLCIQNKRHHPL